MKSLNNALTLFKKILKTLYNNSIIPFRSLSCDGFHGQGREEIVGHHLLLELEGFASGAPTIGGGQGGAGLGRRKEDEQGDAALRSEAA